MGVRVVLARECSDARSEERVEKASVYRAWIARVGRSAFPVVRERFRGEDHGDEVAREGQENDALG